MNDSSDFGIWIIVKNANKKINRNRRWSLEDSIYGTYTADQLKMPRYFTSKTQAEFVLKQAQKLNPSGDYGVVKVTR
jgi:hypothetical protein